MTTPNPEPAPRAADLSAFSQEEFTERLGSIYEHSPWIAQRAWLARPFADRAAIAAAMERVLRDATRDEQLQLVLAHPELTGRAGVRTDLTADSSREQRSAGLDQCTPEEFARLTELNARYRARHGIPFILAVAGRNREQILASLAERVDNTPEHEFATAIEQITRIAGFRLAMAVRD